MKKIKGLTVIILSLLISFNSFVVFAETKSEDKTVFYFDAPANFTDNDKVVCSLWSESAYYDAEGENLGDNLYKFQVENINDYSNMVFCGNSSEYTVKTSFLHGSKGMFPAETYEAFSDNLIDINGKVFTDSIHYISNDFTDNFSFGRWLDYSTWEHKVKFTKYITEKGFTLPDLIEFTVPDFWYRYKELYSDNENYVLAFGSGNEKKNTPAYDVFGDYILKQDESYLPYNFGYYVYLIKEDKFITLREAVDDNVPNIKNAFSECLLRKDVVVNNIKSTLDYISTEDETYTYYFYMPPICKNEFNAVYDGENINTCKAGIFWWDGTEKYPASPAYPGCVMDFADEKDNNIFKARLPKDMSGTVIFNNMVNASLGDDNYLLEKYCDKFYASLRDENGNLCKDMIFVCDIKTLGTVSDFDGYRGAYGEWFYYYGNGKYGKYKTYEEAEKNNEVLERGQFTKDDDYLTDECVPAVVPEYPPSTPVHKHTVVTDKAVKATYTKTGLTAGKHCSTCGEIIVAQKVIPKLTYVALSKCSAKIYVKATAQIKATVKNGKGVTAYKSSNTKVAKVDSKGKVIALKAGTAKITVTNNKVSKMFTVKVLNPELNKTTVSIAKGRTFTLKITGKVGAAKFSTSNKKIATVNSKGKITVNKKAVKGKTCYINVNTNGITLKCKVKVK